MSGREAGKKNELSETIFLRVRIYKIQNVRYNKLKRFRKDSLAPREKGGRSQAVLILNGESGQPLISTRGMGNGCSV